MSSQNFDGDKGGGAGQLGPGSVRDVPPPPGEQIPLPEGLDYDKLPEAVREELEGSDPEVIDIRSGAAGSGVNRCPKCGASETKPLSSGELMCMFCRHKWTTERVEEKYGLGEGIDKLVGIVRGAGAADIEDAGDSAHIVTFKCIGCGAEVAINTENSMSARCHWCRHVLSVNEQIANGAVPDAVLHFRISKEDAIRRIRQFAGRRSFFALKAFKKEFTPENVLGVFLPYMIVDANAAAEVQGEGEIETASYTEGEGNNKTTYYDADVYAVERKVKFLVDDLPIEASSQRSNFDRKANTNNIINTILPFDTENAVAWDASYLAGYSSEKRDLNIDGMMPVLEDQLLSIARSEVLHTLREYDRGVRWDREHLDLKGSRWVVMYLPVWLYSYHQKKGRERGLLHYIAVNGRTGETMGSIPIQTWKLLLAALTLGTVLEGAAIWLIAMFGG